MTCIIAERDEEGHRWSLQLRNCGPRQIGKYCALAKSRAGTNSKEWHVHLQPKKVESINLDEITLDPVIEVSKKLTLKIIVNKSIWQAHEFFRHPGIKKCIYSITKLEHCAK